jgi:hypothetical protein
MIAILAAAVTALLVVGIYYCIKSTLKEPNL